MREAFVVTEIEIGLCTVVGDEDFAVLKRRHGAGINVEIRIELHQVDLQPAALQQATDRSRRQSLTQRRHHSARYKDVLCRHLLITSNCLGKLCRLGCTINYARKVSGCEEEICAVSYSLIAKIRPPPNSPVQVPITDLLGPHIKAPVGLSAGMLARENRCSFQEPPDFAGNEHERAPKMSFSYGMTLSYDNDNNIID